MKYADRVVAARQKYLDIGSQFGAQRMADLVSIALNDPSVMGRNALGAERLGRVFERVKELEAVFDRAFAKTRSKTIGRTCLTASCTRFSQTATDSHRSRNATRSSKK